MRKTIVALWLFLLTGCVSLPDGITPVEGFDPPRYAGLWYEIARLDHPFERGLTDVSALYTLNPNGTLGVVNRGYSEKDGRWKEAKGRARFVNRPDQGFLKVSFFGPFYGAYAVFYLDMENYTYALVSGPDRSYLWIMARWPLIDEALKRKLIDVAASAGFNTDHLIFVTHDRKPEGM